MNGLYNYRNRVYSTDFFGLQTDSINFEDGNENLYRYVKNNPMNYSDPLALNGGPSQNDAADQQTNKDVENVLVIHQDVSAVAKRKVTNSSK